MKIKMQVKQAAVLFAFALASLTSSVAQPASTDVSVPGGQIFIQISKKLLPSVVNIFTLSTVQSPWGGRGGNGGPDDLWKRFFEEFMGDPFGGGMGSPGPQEPARKAMSLGSGFIIEKTNSGGLILTNNHVVEGADEIKVKFTEDELEQETAAEVVGRDRELDVALLKVKTPRNLQPVTLGDSDKLEVGEWIAAIGMPFGHGHSVSHGIVSAKERTLPGAFGNYLQVDAPINPGNSGGPLVNVAGEVVGINNAIDARGPGIGFAIPINFVKKVLDQLKTSGHVERGYIGINVQEFSSELAKALKLDEDRKGPIVSYVVEGKPAARAGIKKSDVILEVGDKRVHTTMDLVNAITSVPVGQKTEITLVRSEHGKISEKKLMVSVESKPDLYAEHDGRIQRGSAKQKAGKAVIAGIEFEQVDPDIAGELGLQDDYKGVVINEIRPDSPGIAAGLDRGDVVVDIKEEGKDTRPVKTVADVQRLLRGKKRYVIGVRRIDDQNEETFEVHPLNLTGKKD